MSPCSPIRLDMLNQLNNQHPVLWKPQIKSRYKAQGCPWLTGTERPLSHTEMLNLTVHPMKKNKQEILCSKTHKACFLLFPMEVPCLYSFTVPIFPLFPLLPSPHNAAIIISSSGIWTQFSSNRIWFKWRKFYGALLQGSDQCILFVTV